MDNSYNIIRIQQYLQGQLSREEMHDLERAALDDPFLNDALEGYRLQKEVNHGKLSLLQQRLATRVEKQKRERDRFFFNGQRLGVAATACVLFILVVVLFWMRTGLSGDAGRQETTKEVEVELPASVSAPSLQPDAVQISITHLSPDPDTEPSAEPVGGWAAFGQYLNDHADWNATDDIEDLPTTGTLLAIGFKIDDSGRPVGIEVNAVPTTRSIALPIRQEIIRLFLEGPAWKGSEIMLQVGISPPNVD